MLPQGCLRRMDSFMLTKSESKKITVEKAVTTSSSMTIFAGMLSGSDVAVAEEREIEDAEIEALEQQRGARELWVDAAEAFAVDLLEAVEVEGIGERDLGHVVGQEHEEPVIGQVGGVAS